MLSPLISSTLFFALVLLLDVSSVSASRNHLNVPRNRHQQLTNRLARADTIESPVAKPLRRRRSCRAPTGAPEPPAAAANTTTTRASETKPPTTTPTKTPIKGDLGGSGGGGKGGGGKPANWPSQTQAGAAPAATRAHPGDPFLKELSKAYNNKNNELFNTVHRGQMTYYGQGLGACGDTYDDDSFTAAVSKLMYDKWPGAVAGEMNRNPICGPFVPGRKTLSQAGNFITAIGGQSYVNIGGDGLLNCAPGVQCHIPLTATVKHGGKQIQVKIVDRCEGCAEGDIDLTPAGFRALADMGLGRTDVEWFFNKY